MLSFFSSKNQMVVFVYALIIEALIILQSKIGTLYPWSEIYLTN